MCESEKKKCPVERAQKKIMCPAIEELLSIYTTILGR